MTRRLPTVADLRAAKGQRQMKMLGYFNRDEAAAAEAAGIDIASVPFEIVSHPRYRDVAPSVFPMTGHTDLTTGSADDDLRWSGQAIELGAGAGCDAHYLFANDILGYTDGHIPRHSTVSRDVKAEYARLQAERIAAVSEFATDVATGVYPEDRHLVAMPPDEFKIFMDRLQFGEGARLT
jgi:ketopantoate hydroxymethyltransferase